MTDFSALNRPDTGAADGGITLKEYRRRERALETACKQFEGTMFSKIWKDMMKSSRSIGGEERKRTYGALEDTAVEMVSEHLSESQGVGVWKLLYDSLHENLPVPEEIRLERAAAAAERSERMRETPLRPARAEGGFRAVA